MDCKILFSLLLEGKPSKITSRLGFLAPGLEKWTKVVQARTLVKNGRSSTPGWVQLLWISRIFTSAILGMVMYNKIKSHKLVFLPEDSLPSHFPQQFKFCICILTHPSSIVPHSEPSLESMESLLGGSDTATTEPLPELTLRDLLDMDNHQGWELQMQFIFRAVQSKSLTSRVSCDWYCKGTTTSSSPMVTSKQRLGLTTKMCALVWGIPTGKNL